MGSLVWEHCFHHLGCCQGVETGCGTCSHFLIFPHVQLLQPVSEGERKTEFSPSSGESCRSLCPLRQGDPGRNPITKYVGYFKTFIFRVLVILSVVVDQKNISLLQAVSCSRVPGGGYRADLKQADFPGAPWEA